MNPAVLALAGVVVAAALTAFGAILNVQSKRITDLEHATQSARAYNLALWQWARTHLDKYYRFRREGSPDPDPIPDETDYN